MKSKEVLKQILVCTVASVPSFLFMITYLNVPTKIFSIVAFTALLWLIILTYAFHHNVSIRLNLGTRSIRHIPLFLYFFCLIATLLLPSINEGIFVSLGSVGAANWTRALAGLMLSGFLPGYTLISIFSHKLRPIYLLITSVLLSIFVNSGITFAAILLAQSAFAWVLITNTIIFSVSLILALHERITNHSINSKNRKNIVLRNEDILLVMLCIFELSILFSVFLLSSLPVPNGDQWDFAALANRLETNELFRFGALIYPPFFSVHLFSVSQLTGFPAMTVSDILGLTNVFSVLAFYALVLTLTKKKAVAFLSTFVFTVFGGFTFLIQALLGKMASDPQSLAQSFLQTSGKTMQINSVYPILNNYAYAPVTLDLLSVIVITVLFLQKNKSRILYAVECLLILNLFLLHVAETIYVLIFFIAALAFNFSKIKDLASLTIGIWIGIIILSTLPFTQSSISFGVAILYTATLAFALLRSKVNVFRKLREVYSKMKNISLKGYGRAMFAFIILSLYGLFLLIWNAFYITENAYISGPLSYLGAAPAYFIPVIFGLPLVISLLYVVMHLVSDGALDRHEKKVILFLAIAFTLAFLLGKGITYVGLLGVSVYRELRVLQVFGGVVFSIITGYALYKTSQYFKHAKVNQKQILGVGLGILVLLGSGSTLLSAVFWTNTGMGVYSLQSNEIEALNYMKKIVNSTDVVLTYSQEATAKVGLTGATTINRFNEPFASVSSSIPKYFLQFVDYIYLTQQEYLTIQKADTYMKSLVSTLSVVYNNSAAVVFSVPQNIKNFLGSSSISVLITDSITGALPKLSLLDSLGISYRVYDAWDPSILLESSTIIQTDDVASALDAQRFTDWVQKGGNLIVLAETEGYYSDQLNIQAKTHVEFQETWPSLTSFGNWTFDLRGELALDNVSISSGYQFQESNSLLVNATNGGTFRIYHSMNGKLRFPFAIGTNFMLINNESTIQESLILMNGQASGIGFWNNDYNLDYYYAGGKVIYNIAQITPNSWQKIELYFPDPETCYVYINSTLVFVGPRGTSYDSSSVTYGSTSKYTLDTWFTGSFQALWNGLYYASPDTVAVDGMSSNSDNDSSFGFTYNLTAPKESTSEIAKPVSWYTSNGQEIAPFAFIRDLGKGNITYLDYASFSRLVPLLSNFSNILIESMGLSSLNFSGQNTTIGQYPIEIYGNQNLNGTINLNSNVFSFSGPNVTYLLELINGTNSFSNASVLSFNSPQSFSLSTIGSVTIQPFQDEYVKILLPNGTNLIEILNQTKGTLRVIDDGKVEQYDLKRLSISSDLPITLVVRSPNITVTGVAKFQGAFFDIPYDSVIGDGLGAITMHGNMTYNISFSDEAASRSFGEEFALKGSSTYDSFQTLLEIELPLNSMAIEQNSLMIAIVFVCAVFLIVLFSKR